ncbi:hypothetical protein [Azospirillum sp. TSO22-1]|uniref:hypothetical protein n=1 Tax=Azospirillum sp. TSO22-1 TaxID=716789 RepID=UPI000D60ABB0|nr:hypothetical protein [Azospirillum sp. TSO22-1]PWC43829.1 hypothetical protein TSO221_18935 [Azospirillum sp. TSO22-1]
MIPAFDRFVAIDWSGAKGRRYAGVAVAECVAGDDPPTLVEPPTGWWSRQAVFEWLRAGLERGPALVGIDCAFSLPFAVARTYFPAEATAFDLWDLIEQATAGHPDFLGGPFAEHPAFAAGFWTGGRQPAWYTDPHRLTERVCRADGYGSPQSPYKLIGSKQVGRGALAGIRMLRALRATDPRVAVWPFEEPAPGRTVFAEIYPRLFLKRAGFGLRKIRAPEDVDAALAHLKSRPAKLPASVSDHDADALVSAAGLRWLAARPEVWSPAALDGTARRQEGWIFGVGDRANAS